MEPSKLNELSFFYDTIAALLNDGQFPGTYAESVVRAKTFVFNMRAALAAKIKEESNESSGDSKNAAGVAGSAAGDQGRKSRKRKGN